MNALLVDGSGLAYRSYFAFVRNPLRSTRGEETSLSYGFLTAVLRWCERYAPEHVAIVFDPPGRTHRHALYAEYKAQRPARPEGLVAQQPRLREVLAALRVAVVEIPGWEADDVLATLARRFEAAGSNVWLATADKDLQQLVSPRVRLVRPAPMGNDAEMGPAELEERTGLRPEQIVDWLALAGDASDNIPGVAGVGDKTALELLREHGTLAGVYADLDRVTRPAVRRRLEAGRAAAELSRTLVELRSDAPVDATGLDWPGIDWAVLTPLLEHLEFFQILRQKPAVARSGGAPLGVATAIAADGPAWRAALEAASGAGAIAIAAAFDGVPRVAPVTAVAVAWGDRTAVAADVASVPPAPRPGELDLRLPAGRGVPEAALVAALQPLLADPARIKIGFDCKALAFTLARAGAPMPGPYFDTLLAAYVLDPGRRTGSIAALAQEHLGLALDVTASDAAAQGAAATALWALRDVLTRQLESDGLAALFRDVETPLVEVLLAMELEGVGIDRASLDALAADLEQRAAGLAESIYAACGRRFNLQSTQQLGQVLFNELALPHGRRTRTGWSTDVDVLERLAGSHAVAAQLLEHRQLMKLRSTYAEALPRLMDPATGRIHTRFNQTVASTGRLSSSDPNLQNIPIRTELGRRIRAAFVPRDRNGWMLAADYSQIELRLLAHLSQDPALVAAFQQGQDVHQQTAARVFGCDLAAVTPEQRAAAKTVNFGVIYGMGPRGLADRLGIPLAEAKRFIDEYFAGYPGVRAFTHELVERARANGFTTTLLGRRMRLPGIASSQPAERAGAERVAINAPIQGSAADLIKVAMLRVHRRLQAAGLRSRLVLQVHDELVFDVAAGEQDEVAAIAQSEMEGAVPLRVPVVVDVGCGATWAEAHR